MKLFFKVLPNATYDILMIDHNRFNGIRYNEESFESDKLEYNKADHNYFDIEIAMKELNYRDPDADCINYTNSTFQNYFEKSAKNALAYIGCNLPWCTDNEETIFRYDTPHITERILNDIPR